MIKKIWRALPSPDTLQYQFSVGEWLVSVKINKKTDYVKVSIRNKHGK